MKKIFTFLFLALFVIGANAQYPNATFEGDTDVWTQFGNGNPSDPANLMIVENPYKDGVNSSDSCMMFNITPEGVNWAGFWADRGDLEFTNDNHLMYMMVYKDVISPVGLKLESGAEVTTIKVPNTVTEEWEVLEFDFSELIGLLRTRTTVFPDYPDDARPEEFEGSLNHVDNIDFIDHTGIGEEVTIKRVNGTFMSIYPNPATEIIRIQYPGMKSITISNIVGQTVRSVVAESNYIERVPVSDLQAGVYFVTLDTEDGLVSSKFVKE